MSNRRLLLLSNSKNYGQGYLEHAEQLLQEFLGPETSEVVFVPFAGVRMTFDAYTDAVRSRFQELGYSIKSVHDAKDPAAVIGAAEAIAVGGGNTFHLLATLSERNLLEPIRTRARAGVPYIGWSAGSNVACPTIRTTNDMPIVEPPSLAALDLIPFQINPHYTDAKIPHHGGETREERLLEFVATNPRMPVLGLREGSILRVEGDDLRVVGPRARVFLDGRSPFEIEPGDDLGFLLAWGAANLPGGASRT